MLEPQKLNKLCEDLNIPKEGKKIIDNIRNSQPSRVVGGGAHNVSGRYPSNKMGLTIQFESHKVELPRIYEMEYLDDSVLEYYDQPRRIKLNYVSKRGKKVGVISTPDFFVIREDSIAWEEWKTEEELLKLSKKSPNRYKKEIDGTWRCPPGEEYAKQFGMEFKLRSSAEIDWMLQRNVLFLEDYMLDKNYKVDEEAKELIIDSIKNQPGLLLIDLLEKTDRYTSDDIYYLIGKKHIYVNLYKYCLAEPDVARIFLNSQQEKSYTNIEICDSRSIFSAATIDIEIGKKIIWDSKVWVIINFGKESLTLISENKEAIDLPLNIFMDYVNQKKIEGIDPKNSDKEDSKIKEILLKADEGDLKIANDRYEFVYKKINNQEIDYSIISPRTLREWAKRYREAAEIYGNGFLGLIPRNKEKGNNSSKLPNETIELMNDFIDKKYENNKQKSKQAVHGQLEAECEKRGILSPSYMTFCTYVKNRSKENQVRKREGKRAAHNHETFYWEISLTTPRHGDRPFEICHIDHTELDIELVHSKTGKNLGKPWLTLLHDAFTRRVLSFYLAFDEPSYRSCMMVLRECVKTYNRLPQTLVVDGGKEFSSVYFESLLAFYHITKKTRPPAKSRFGSVIERMFGTTNKMFIHNLQGNTQPMKNVRQVTKSINPKNHAVWTLQSLYKRLEEWVNDKYDKREHSSLGQSPREAFNLGIQESGMRPFRLIPYDDDFLIMTLPPTKSGSAKVYHNKGVKIRNIHYWNDAMKKPQVQGKKVKVRYDPFNIGIAYVYIQNKWVQCISEHYPLFKDRTEKELMLITQQIRKQKSNTSRNKSINAKEIAQFINSVESEEAVLNQRIKDNEVQKTLKLVDYKNEDHKEENEDYKENSTNNRERKSIMDLVKDKLCVYEEY